MNGKRQMFRLLALIVFTITIAIAADAQATRTWISGVGDDVNPCSRTAPCKTFAGAISKTATGGEINCLDPGGFGAVTVTKSLTLDCSGTLGSILASGTTGIIINSPAAIVRIRGIAINGTYGGTLPGVNGIRILAAANVVIENVVIDGFAQTGVSVESANDVKVFIKNSSIRNSLTGVAGSPAVGADIFIADSSITGNGTGINAGANATFRLSGNSIAHNTTGLQAQAKGRILSFKNNSIDANVTNGATTTAITQQ